MAATDFSGSLLSIGFASIETLSGSLLTLGFDSTYETTGNLLTLGFAHQNTFSGSLLTLGVSNEAYAEQAKNGFHFPKSRHLSPFAADFNLRVTINGANVDLCKFASELTISHGENESFVCYFTMQETKNRPTLPIDLYQWYGKEIVIDYVTATGETRLYRGIVDSAELDFLSGKTKFTCTDRRKRMIDKLSKSVVQSIGYTSEAIHGKFDNLSDELGKRLQTVAASFEFDSYGNGYLNYWKPQNPTLTISDCEIFYTNPIMRLAQVGQVVNRVDIEFTYNYSRLRQRTINYNYSSGLTACTRGYTQFPTLDGLIEAVSQTGWVMQGGRFERLPTSQWLNCNGTMTGWRRGAGDKGIVSGSFTAMKRWTQNASEKYTISLINQASINRYEELKESVSGSVNAQADTDNWKAPETPEFVASTGNTFTTEGSLSFGSGTRSNAPSFKGANFYRANNGEWVGNLDTADAEFQAAFKVLYWTAYMKMLASHRQNTFEADMKFLPSLSIRHSHRINHTHFQGLVKVAGFTHTFDLINRHVKTRIRYKFFQNAESVDVLTEPQTPSRLNPTFDAFQGNFTIRRVDLEKEADVEQYKGLIYQKSHVTFRTQNYSLVGWRIPTPDIAKKDTDAVELTGKQDYAVGLYGDSVTPFV